MSWSSARCFDVPYPEHAKRMCRYCPRRITKTAEKDRPAGWREEALADLHPLHICAFMLRDFEITPQTVVERKHWQREFADIEYQERRRK